MEQSGTLPIGRRVADVNRSLLTQKVGAVLRLRPGWAAEFNSLDLDKAATSFRQVNSSSSL